MEHVSDEDARIFRDAERKHELVRQLSGFADIVALDVPLNGVLIGAMSEDIQADLVAWREQRSEGDLRAELSKTADDAVPIPNEAAHQATLPNGKLVLIEQFHWDPPLAKMYYPANPG
jgi:hypothetical protein